MRTPVCLWRAEDKAEWQSLPVTLLNTSSTDVRWYRTSWFERFCSGFLAHHRRLGITDMCTAAPGFSGRFWESKFRFSHFCCKHLSIELPFRLLPPPRYYYFCNILQCTNVDILAAGHVGMSKSSRSIQIHFKQKILRPMERVSLSPT